jgi:hypothetical protein
MSLVEFEPSEIERLLDLLNQRLRRRRLKASIYVVGGAAIAITVPGASDRRTVDVDAVVSDRAVLEEAEALAQEQHLPRHWLNPSAAPWIPPRPPRAQTPPRRFGLTIHWAPPEHLLAMKLVAMRPQDSPDIANLSRQLGLGADAQEYANLLFSVYDGEDALQTVLNVPHDDVGTEALRRGQAAVRLMESAAQ